MFSSMQAALAGCRPSPAGLPVVVQSSPVLPHPLPPSVRSPAPPRPAAPRRASPPHQPPQQRLAAPRATTATDATSRPQPQHPDPDPDPMRLAGGTAAQQHSSAETAPLASLRQRHPPSHRAGRTGVNELALETGSAKQGRARRPVSGVRMRRAVRCDDAVPCGAGRLGPCRLGGPASGGRMRPTSGLGGSGWIRGAGGPDTTVRDAVRDARRWDDGILVSCRRGWLVVGLRLQGRVRDGTGRTVPYRNVTVLNDHDDHHEQMKAKRSK